MTNHINVDESFVKSLVENAAWDEARLSVTEAKQEETVEASKEEAEVVEEEKEELVQATQPLQEDEHFCPLCESTLEEELSDERIMEHLAQIEEALAQELEEEGPNTRKMTDAEKAAGRKLAGLGRDKPGTEGKPVAAKDNDGGSGDDEEDDKPSNMDTDEMMEKKKKAKKKIDAMKERYASKAK